jgi:hypothetical protein
VTLRRPPKAKLHPDKGGLRGIGLKTPSFLKRGPLSNGSSNQDNFFPVKDIAS